MLHDPTGKGLSSEKNFLIVRFSNPDQFLSIETGQFTHRIARLSQDMSRTGCRKVVHIQDISQSMQKGVV